MIDAYQNKLEISLEPEDSYNHFSSNKQYSVDCILHVNFCMEIVIVTEGTLHMEIGGTEYEILAGQGAFVRPFETHSFISKQENLSHIITFSPNLVPDFYHFQKYHLNKTPIWTLSKETMGIVDKFLPDTSNSPDVLHAVAALAPLCCEIADTLEYTSCESLFEDSFFQAIEYVNTHFTENITLVDAAREAGMHPVTFSKKFTKYVHSSFPSYLSHLRCNHAACLLLQNNLSFAEIAYVSGFGSIRTFNRCFLSVYGTTPTQFQKSPEIIGTGFFH